ncbi:chitin synthase domain-containing protein [Hirsutella rhossiliensis]|uniref:chitin synthase n=1 Tax=Hirsutella rhossiliensis TaxID=111463 RepID=A0A9P8MXT0_9HYPO|nr:chitin synthase domain-containing protein [Hirsutella rhossiliensis]KAH0964298.1 chitin synthase domain-containing protein [Hirsutella rhossiliensis]
MAQVSTVYPFRIQRPGNEPEYRRHDSDGEKSDACRAACGYPILPQPLNPARKLTRTELRTQRAVFIIFVLVVNLGLAAVTLFAKIGVATLVFVLLFKLQDCLSAIITILCLSWTSVASLFHKSEPVSRQWVLSLLPAYNESEEQMLKSIRGLRENVGDPHKQVIAIVLDGQPKDIRGEFSRVVAEFQRPYLSLKQKSGILKVTAGFFFQDLPVILIEKVQNSGKKDSLVLTHDLFNHPRDNMPEYTRLLREEIWTTVLPALTAETDFRSFDMIFCTDADSLIHEGCMIKLIDRLARDEKAIAACGLVLVEFEPGYEWSPWNFFQLLQYAYGQSVRRWAEGFVGKVTCLPGCVTMIAVRKEMAGAIAMFARPVKENWVLHHQVQNLGTDRRLTYCMLSQSKGLRTLFVPDAVSETVAPQSFKHYLHQRRRWGSNAYFNNFFYCGGRNMILYTRFLAFLHIMRQTCVYYRILNTILFIRALVIEFSFMDILPLLVVGQFPALWFCVCMVIQRALRVRIHKLIVGFLINKLVSPIMSSIVFAAVVTNLGNAVWGMSGITASSSGDSQRPSTQASSSTTQQPPLPR